MKWSFGKWALLILAFVTLAILKLHDYDRTPGTIHGEELLYSWSGINLIETGTPISWSTLNYPKENKVFEGVVGKGKTLGFPATLYKPWLDEPPLYSLLSGGSAHLFKANRNEVIPSSYVRIPSVLASLATMALIFVVGLTFFNYWIGMLAMLFYGVTPILVFGSRLSVPENMIALGVMSGLLLAKKYLEKPRWWMAAAFGIMTLILGLMKPTGFFMAPLAIFLSLKKRRWFDVVIITGFTVLGIAGFMAYGAHYDWNLFKTIVGTQGTRFAGWSGLPYILVSPAFDIFQIIDGWYIFAFLMAIFFSLRKGASPLLKLVNFFFFYWLMVAVFSGTEQDLLPWYRYTFFPLLAIYGAMGLAYLYKKADFMAVALTLGMLLSSRFLLANAFRPTTPTIVFRVVFLLALVPSLLEYAWNVKWAKSVSRVIVIFFLALGIFYNAKYIYSAFTIRCESVDCPFGPTTKLSEVKMPFLWRFLVPEDDSNMLTTRRPKF